MKRFAQNKVGLSCLWKSLWFGTGDDRAFISVCPSCGNRQWFVSIRPWTWQFYICSDYWPCSKSPKLLSTPATILLVILTLGFCSLYEQWADSLKLLFGHLVSLGAEVVSAPCPLSSDGMSQQRRANLASAATRLMPAPDGLESCWITFARLVGPAAKWSPDL